MGVCFNNGDSINQIEKTDLKYKTKFFEIQQIESKQSKIIYKNSKSTIQVAIQKATDTKFLVKKINKHQLARSKFNFFDIDYLPNIAHKHLNPLQDIYEDSKFFYLVYSWPQGIRLIDFIKVYKSISERLMAEICIQLLDFVSQLNSFGFAHFNICPEIIWIHPQTLFITIIDTSTVCQPEQYRYDIQDLNLLFSSPEMVTGTSRPDMNTDIYNIGILTFILLQGDSPQDAKNNNLKKLKRAIELGMIMDIQKTGEKLKLSADCTNFLKLMLTFNPEKRLNAMGLLDNNYINQHVVSRINSYDFKNSQIIQNICNFKEEQLVPNLLGVFCEFQNVANVIDLFLIFDKDRSNQIDDVELAQILQLSSSFQEAKELYNKVSAIVKLIDTNGNNMIEYEEFAMLAYKFDANQQTKLEYQFTLLDIQRGGELSLDHILSRFKVSEDNISLFWKMMNHMHQEVNKINVLELIDGLMRGSDINYLNDKWQTRVKAKAKPIVLKNMDSMLEFTSTKKKIKDVMEMKFYNNLNVNVNQVQYEIDTLKQKQNLPIDNQACDSDEEDVSFNPDGHEKQSILKKDKLDKDGVEFLEKHTLKKNNSAQNNSMYSTANLTEMHSISTITTNVNNLQEWFLNCHDNQYSADNHFSKYNNVPIEIDEVKVNEVEVEGNGISMIQKQIKEKVMKKIMDNDTIQLKNVEGFKNAKQIDWLQSQILLKTKNLQPKYSDRNKSIIEHEQIRRQGTDLANISKLNCVIDDLGENDQKEILKLHKMPIKK